MNGVSHLAIGVRNMERSVHFYRDLLGLELKYDEMQPVGGLSNLYRNPEKGQRHAVHLHYGKGENAGFLVLTEMPGGIGAWDIDTIAIDGNRSAAGKVIALVSRNDKQCVVLGDTVSLEAGEEFAESLVVGGSQRVMANLARAEASLRGVCNACGWRMSVFTVRVVVNIRDVRKSDGDAVFLHSRNISK